MLPRRHHTDREARNAAVAEQLAGDGAFEATLHIPDTAGDLIVVADVRTNEIRCRITLEAPNEGTSGRRLSWLLKQLPEAPGELQIGVAFSEKGNETCELLAAVRADSKVLTEGRTGSIVSFTLEQAFPMGSRRSGTATSFITSVTEATDAFYGSVVQPLRGWVPAAPKQPEPSADDAALVTGA
ncbi:hypothetical protein [Nocardia crassostreae]|uniref:hypothetical protein n=1 Tax=Nocardia crassostreae TaxID=53428 RepID=UPI000AF9499D|nr:hypothetical protein [Nocardia crassostreae]